MGWRERLVGILNPSSSGEVSEIVEGKAGLQKLPTAISDFASEILEVVGEGIEQENAFKRQQDEERAMWEESLRQQKEQTRQGNLRAKEIAQDSGVVEIFEEAKTGLAIHYPSVTLIKGYPLGNEFREILDLEDITKSPRIYGVALAWYRDSRQTPAVMTWSRESLKIREGVCYVLARCDGFSGNIKIKGTVLVEEEWQNDKNVLRTAIREAVRNPSFIPVTPETSWLNGAQR